ncbi:MAG TPA: hypothetical protein VK176_09475 [Phycisphaerales bacterium]|nr:hypothetical protein [Phycisphaerales bacterium]
MAKAQHDPADPVSMFDDLFPAEAVLEIARGVRSAYATTEREMAKFDDIEAADLRPYHRRAHVETALRHVATKHERELTLCTNRNAADNCSHRAIVCNGVLLTSSLVPVRAELPRNATFRRSYARSPQGFLEFAEEPIDEKALLYAIVTHAPDTKDKTMPAFIDIIFPCSRYIDIVGRIRVIDDRFPAEFGRAAAAVVEVMPDLAVPRLKPAAQQKRKQA